MAIRRFSLMILIWFITISIHSSVLAYNRKHYIKLLETKVCINCDLTFAPLSRIDLTGADLRGSLLMYATFKQSTLFKAKLPSSKNYKGANFTGAMWVDGGICQIGSYGTCTCYGEDQGGSSCEVD